MNFSALILSLAILFSSFCSNEAAAQNQNAKKKGKLYENWNTTYHPPTRSAAQAPMQVAPQAAAPATIASGAPLPSPTLTPDAKLLETNEDPTVAAESLRNMQGQAFSIINSLNPMADKNSAAPTDPMAAMADPNFAATLGRLAELQKLLESPWVRGYLQVMTNQEVVTGLGKLANKPKEEMKRAMYFELGALAFYFIFSLWFFARGMSFMSRLMWKILFFFGITFITSYVIPSYVIGKDYSDFIAGLIQAIRAVTK